MKVLLLATDELKTRLLSLIKQSFEARGWQLDHWVILNNHYHLFFLAPRLCLGADFLMALPSDSSLAAEPPRSWCQGRALAPEN